jgi:LVIVD repeat
VRRLVVVLLVCAAALAVWAPCALAAAPGINALYLAGRSGRDVTFGVEGSIIHYKAGSFGWTDAFQDWMQASVSDIDVEWGRAYVALGARGLHILNVSDPARPSEMGAYEESGFHCTRVCAYGPYLYAATLHDVQVLNVSDAAAPVALSNMYIQGDGSGIDDVDVANGCAYVVGYVPSSDYPFTHMESLLIFDVTDPANPVWTGGCSLPDASGPISVTVSGNQAYVGGDLLCVVDVSNSSSPRYLSWASSTKSRVGSLCAGPAVDSRYCFAASDDEMNAFNITGEVPQWVGDIPPLWPYSTGVGVALTESGARKRYALVAYDKAGDLNGYVTINDASRPLRFDHDHGEWTGGGGSIKCLTVDGDWAYEGRGAETVRNFVVTHLGPTAYSWKLDRRARTLPDKRADGTESGLLTFVSVKAKGKGVWYFHVRGRDNSGHWGPAAHIKIRVS